MSSLLGPGGRLTSSVRGTVSRSPVSSLLYSTYMSPSGHALLQHELRMTWSLPAFWHSFAGSNRPCVEYNPRAGVVNAGDGTHWPPSWEHAFFHGHSMATHSMGSSRTAAGLPSDSLITYRSSRHSIDSGNGNGPLPHFPLRLGRYVPCTPSTGIGTDCTVLCTRFPTMERKRTTCDSFQCSE